MDHRTTAHVHGSRSIYALLVWAGLFAWLVVAFSRGETFRNDDVSLPALVLFMMTAVLGSQVWLMFRDRRYLHHR